MTNDERLRQLEAEVDELRPLKVFLPKAIERIERAGHDLRISMEVAMMTALPPKSKEQLAIEAEIPRLEREWQEARDRAFGALDPDRIRILQEKDPGYAQLMDAERALQRAKGQVTAFDQARQLAARTGNQTSPIRRLVPAPVVRVFDNFVSALASGAGSVPGSNPNR
jgi:hypothetical protein